MTTIETLIANHPRATVPTPEEAARQLAARRKAARDYMRLRRQVLKEQAAEVMTPDAQRVAA